MDELLHEPKVHVTVSISLCICSHMKKYTTNSKKFALFRTNLGVFMMLLDPQSAIKWKNMAGHYQFDHVST